MNKIIYLIIIIFLVSCKELSEKEILEFPEFPKEEKEILEFPEFPKEEDINTSSKSKSYIWDSKNIKLPKGIVMKKDHSHSKDGDDQSDNYVTIQLINNKVQIFRDIDVDTYLNLEIGDSIQ